MQLVVFFVVAVVAAFAVTSLLGLAANVFIALVMWMLAGMFAGRLLRGKGYGPVGDILLGLIGGLVGSFVLSLLRLGWVGDIWLVGNILVGIIGAVIFVYAVRLIAKSDFAR